MLTLNCKCGNLDPSKFKVIVEGTRKGLYCAVCGKWQKWLSKDEYNLAIMQNLEIITKN